MLDWLTAVDSSLFVFFNSQLANPATDVLMPAITYRWTVRGIFAGITLYLMIFDGKRGRLAAVAAIIAVAVADQVAASIIKPWVGRIRPCHVIEQINLLVDCSKGLSFPSAHAANSMAVATVLLFIYPRARWPLLVFAILVSYSRIAVGVHYPLDVGGGICLGIVVGVASFQLYRQAELRWLGPQSYKAKSQARPG